VSAACAALAGAGVIRGVIATVDCQTRAYAEGAYQALTAGSPVFQAALTGLLTIYVALVGYRMLFAHGGARLSDAPGVALRVGAVLALVTSWATFQTLVFDLADRAPAEIAALAAAPLQQGASALAADPVNGLQVAYDELTASATAFGKAAGAEAKAYSNPQAAAAEALSSAAAVLFLASAGAISAAKLAVGVLTAVGPVFIALFLIPATRGLFAGWLRALAGAALTPLAAWLLMTLLLVVLEPWLVVLAQQRRDLQLDPQTAVSAAALVYVFALAQAGLVIGAGVMAAGLRLPGGRAHRAADPPASAPAAAQAPILQPSRAERLALDLRRDQAMASVRGGDVVRAMSVAPSRATAGPSAAPRLGDAYRRPGPTPRRTGLAR